MLFIVPVVCYGGDSSNIYVASTIKKELTEKAISVKRLYDVKYKLEGPDKASISYREVTTLLSPKAERELFYYIYTDKFRLLEDMELKLYDANGKVIEQRKKKDMAVTNPTSGLLDDDKVYYTQLSTAAYPVTIEANYTMRHKGLLQLPEFIFCSPLQSVELAKLELTHPVTLVVNYKNYQFEQEPRKTTSGSYTTLLWEARNFTANTPEDQSGDWRFLMPHVSFNMPKIEYDGYSGDMSSWTSMGLWYNSILGGNNKLNAKYQDEIRAMVTGISDPKSKVRKLYNHLQKNFRYVSIQLGIGGFKPFPADFVHEKKYGDCKGLSNYMEACLAAVGIRAYSVWINSGAKDVNLDTDFPHDSFDHQILMVPMGKDTVWLECTSDINDFGHLGSFTENRYGLVLTETGGKLIRTPMGKADENSLVSSTVISLTPDGEATTQTAMTCTGEFKYMMIQLSKESASDQKTYLLDYFGMKQPDEFSLTYDAAQAAGYTTKIDLYAEKGYEFKAGSKFFFRPRTYKNWTTRLEENKERKLDYFIKFPFVKIDTTVFILSDGFQIETLPAARQSQFSGGSFESTYRYDPEAKKVFAVSKLVVNQSRIPAASYQEAKRFFDQVMEDGNQKLIFLNNNGLANQ